MVRRSVAALAALLVLAAAPPAAAQLATLAPVDEAARDPDLARFRSALLEAVERRDTAFVIGALSDDALAGFGADAGPEGFRRAWLSDDRPPGEDLWTVLGDVLRDGGAFVDDSTFQAPYAAASFPEGLDPFATGVVTGAGVRVRSEPGLSAPVLAHLSHAVVPVETWGDPVRGDGHAWHRVRLSDGRAGWVAGGYLRSPVGYRALLVRRDGRWRLRSLLAGD